MTRSLILLLIMLIISFSFALEQDKENMESLHTNTLWEVTPSIAYDALCFLNIASGDQFYTEYYPEEYKRFEPLLSPEIKNELAYIKKVIKDDNGGIISAMLTLYFSAGPCETLDDLILALKDSSLLKKNLQDTPYFDEASWQQFEDITPHLLKVIKFMRDDLHFATYWNQEILPKLIPQVDCWQKKLNEFNIVPAIECYLGHPLSDNQITVYMLYFVKPHGIRITGIRFLTDQSYPFDIIPKNAIHELFHPPYDIKNDEQIRKCLASFSTDPFIAYQVKNHNPSFGYNSFEGYMEEDCTQALDMIVTQKYFSSDNAKIRWKESDEGMHVFAAALYAIMKKEGYDINTNKESFRNFMLRMVKSGLLTPGSIEKTCKQFYEN